MVLIFVNQKEALKKIDFLTTIHSRLCLRFNRKIDTFSPISLHVLNQYLGQVWHLSKQETKVLLNQMAERGLCEIRKGSGIANYFIIIRRSAK